MKKIIATLGPSTFNQKIVEKLDESGVDIFRINLSHTEIKDYQKLAEKISIWTKKPVCPDTEGAQIRTGKIINNKNILSLKKSDFVELVDKDNYKDFDNQIPLSIKSPEKIIKQGDLLKIDFDSAIVQATKIDQKSVICRVITEGEIGSNKGISSDRKYIISPLSEKDITLMKVANKLKQDTIFLSF